jgi:hypothetical protein
MIIAHANPRTFQRLIAALEHPDIGVFVHIDARSDIAPFLANQRPGVTFLTDRIANNWGAFTQIEVALALLHAARAAGPFGSHVLVSGDSLPLVTNEILVEALTATPTALRLREQFPEDKSFQRVREVYLPATRLGRIRGHRSHLERFLTAEDLEEMQRAIRVRDLKANLPFRVFKGSQWFALSDRHVGLILERIAAEPEAVDIFRYSLIPDELFFHTLLRLVDPDYESPGGIMEVDWTRKPKPFTLKQRGEADLVYASKSLFFRKFCDEGLELVDAVLARRLDAAGVKALGAGTAWRFLRGSGLAARLHAAEPARDEAAEDG